MLTGTFKEKYGRIVDETDVNVLREWHRDLSKGIGIGITSEAAFELRLLLSAAVFRITQIYTWESQGLGYKL